MAKGNLFQGMARGKVGDVVFYRMNGVQMSRVRNRTPKNPRSVEQLYQRAIIASVMKMYSAGKEILDHAFQGYTIGEGCMRRFNSVNARILREQVISDVNNPTDVENQTGRLVSPKCLSYVPIIGAMISEGTLEQNLFAYGFNEPQGPTSPPGSSGWRGADGTGGFSLNASSSDYTEETSVNQLFAKFGIYAGDIFTFVFGKVNTLEWVYNFPYTKANYTTVYKSYFEWMRLIVKSNISDDIKVSTAKFSDVFDIESNMPTTTFDAGQSLTGDVTFKSQTNIKIATIGCIRSRLDVDLRSTSYMQKGEWSAYGIVPSFILQVWQQEVIKVGTSELILEGGDEALVNTMNLENIDNTPITPAAVDEAEVPTMARHKGTRNYKK